MLLAVIVLSCDAADGDAVALGGGIEPRLLDLIKGHHLFARIEVRHLIGFLFPFSFLAGKEDGAGFLDAEVLPGKTR